MWVNLALGYAFIGSVLWVLLDSLGVVGGVHSNRLMQGRPATARGLVLATLFLILGWPVFVILWLRGMRRRV